MSHYKREDKKFKAEVAQVADRVNRETGRLTTATIDENGDVLFLASTENDIFCELGSVVTKRASHVEPATFWARRAFHFLRLFGNKTKIAEWTRGWRVFWRVNTKPVGGPVIKWKHVYPGIKKGVSDYVYVWSDRQQAIDFEIEFLNKFFLAGGATQ